MLEPFDRSIARAVIYCTEPCAGDEEKAIAELPYAVQLRLFFRKISSRGLEESERQRERRERVPGILSHDLNRARLLSARLAFERLNRKQSHTRARRTGGGGGKGLSHRGGGRSGIYRVPFAFFPPLMLPLLLLLYYTTAAGPGIRFVFSKSPSEYTRVLEAPNATTNTRTHAGPIYRYKSGEKVCAEATVIHTQRESGGSDRCKERGRSLHNGRCHRRRRRDDNDGRFYRAAAIRSKCAIYIYIYTRERSIG